MKKEVETDFVQFKNSPWKFIFFVARQKKWFGVAAILFAILTNLLVAGIYFIVRDITNAISNFDGDLEGVYFLVTLFMGVMILKTIFGRSSGFIASWWVTNIEIFSAQVSFDYLSRHSAKFFSNNLSGKLQSKIYNISSSVERIVPMLMWNFMTVTVRMTVSVAIAFWVDYRLGVIFLFFIGVILFISYFLSKRIAILSKDYTNRSSDAKGVMVDVISNIMAAKQNTALERESKNVGEFLSTYQKAHMKVWRFIDYSLLGIGLLLVAMFGCVLYFSIYLWGKGFMSSGDVVMIFTMLVALVSDLEYLSMTISNFMEKVGQLKEGLEAIFVPHDITDEDVVERVKISKGEIEFDRVDFNYEEDEEKSVFENLSLKIRSGEKVGLVGESGAGKTTFVSLLLRFMDTEGGAIKIDGHDISRMRQDDLRRAIAYVPQEALLFHRSLEENIKYSNPDADESQMLSASKNAHALDFIERLPERFRTLVGERGVKLSGGQKQRVMIARAMLKKSPILVLDEATSALDSKSEKFIQESLEELMKGRTTIAIAHRLSTLKKMDRIIVFDDGKIVEDGSHNELVRKKGKYYELWRHQTMGMA
jgi:ATP-binding cassette subfamily B protein